MARVILPLLGVEAHGALGRTIVYRSRRDGVTVGRYKRQRDAESAAQLVQREKFAAAAVRWAGLGDEYKGKMSVAGAMVGMTGWNLYLHLSIGENYVVAVVGISVVGGAEVVG